MTNIHFLIVVTLLTLAHGVVRPGWYTTIMFTVSALSFVATVLLSAKEDTTSKKEIEELRLLVTELGTQVKSTANKLTGLRLQIGLKD